MVDVAAYDALVGVALGAGLTYGFGALNRRHQEAREDATRWYDARLSAYIDLSHAMGDMTTLLFHPEEPPPEVRFEVMEALHSAQRTVHIVGSPDFFEEADALTPIAARILQGPRPPTDEDKHLWSRKVLEITSLARHDLGYPDTWGAMMQWLEERRERTEGKEHSEEIRLSRYQFLRARLSAKMQLARRRWRPRP